MATPNNEKPIIVAFTLDFETGGLDCQDCACTQIAIHAVRIDTFETIDRYVKYISPYNKQPDKGCLLYTSPSPRDRSVSRMPSSA